MGRKIILVGGYCATGKSTFSRKLEELLNIPCFNKDRIKEIMGEGVGPENKNAISVLSNTTFTLMLYIAEKFMKSGNALILESNFRKLEGERIKALVQKYGYDCLTFVFTGDLDILYRRYAERDDSSERHWVHKSASEARDLFAQGNLQFGELEIGRQTVKTDATVFENVDYGSLFDLAKDFVMS